MILLTHIIIALSSLVATTFMAISPSMRKLYVSYGLIAATLATGTYLVISTHISILHVCTTGLTYLAVAMAGVLVGQYRLAKQRATGLARETERSE